MLAFHIVSRMNDAAAVALRRCAAGRILAVVLSQRATAQHSRRAGERRDHQPVPRGQHLVVELRTRPWLTRVEQDLTRPQQRFGDVDRRLVRALGEVGDRLRRIQQVLVDELVLRIERRVAIRQNAVTTLEDRAVVAERGANLLGGPDVERAFDFMCAGVVSRSCLPTGALAKVDLEAAPAAGCPHPPPNRSRRFASVMSRRTYCSVSSAICAKNGSSPACAASRHASTICAWS